MTAPPDGDSTTTSLHTPGTSRRAAVSSLSAALVRGPIRPAGVVASTSLGCYLLVEDCTVLPILTPAALALPTAVRLADVGGSPGFELGTRAVVGEGRITGPGWCVEVVRTFRPASVRRWVTPPGAEPTPIPARTGLMDLLESRLGLGPGLTPEGDDEIAGHLLVAVAAAAPVPDLEPHLHRTTALSASLLRAAAQGYAVPVVVGYIDAVLANDHHTTARLRPTIEAIGHTSGPALLRGIHAAARHHALDVALPNERTVA